MLESIVDISYHHETYGDGNVLPANQESVYWLTCSRKVERSRLKPMHFDLCFANGVPTDRRSQFMQLMGGTRPSQHV